MARIGISITKRVAFRDSLQEFSNVYHYNVGVTPNIAEALVRISELETFEKGIHSTLVTFVRGRCWTTGGTKAENNMIAQATLSGTGSLTPTSSLDLERAYLVRWPAGFSVEGKPVFLRKWYHAGGVIGSATISASIMQNTTGFTQTQRDSYANICNAVKEIGGLDEYDLCSATGRETTGDAQGHKYLEHHQLGDMWRAQ